MKPIDLGAELWGEDPLRAVLIVLCGALAGVFIAGLTFVFQPNVLLWRPGSVLESAPQLAIIFGVALAFWWNRGALSAFPMSIAPVYTLKMYSCCFVTWFHDYGMGAASFGTFFRDLLEVSVRLWALGVIVGFGLRILERGLLRVAATTAEIENA